MSCIKIIYFFITITFILPLCYAGQQVTHEERGDGFGAQFQTLIYTVVGAELCNLEYRYTPFNKMEHNYDNNPDFIAQKEWLINFKDNFEANTGDALPLDTVKVFNFFESNLDACIKSSSLQKIKKIFKANKNRSDYLKDGCFHIVVHIRRHNPNDNRIAGTNTPDEVFMAVINKLRIIYADKQPLFHIHSQGKYEDFKQYNAPDVSIHLNESVENSFIPMVLADVLVTSPSSFSYAAALISENIVYYMPYWHPPLPGWKLVTDLF